MEVLIGINVFTASLIILLFIFYKNYFGTYPPRTYLSILFVLVGWY